MNLLQKLNDWANSWSPSQLIFLFALVGACLAVALYQGYVIHQLAAALKP